MGVNVHMYTPCKLAWTPSPTLHNSQIPSTWTQCIITYLDTLCTWCIREVNGQRVLACIPPRGRQSGRAGCSGHCHTLPQELDLLADRHSTHHTLHRNPAVKIAQAALTPCMFPGDDLEPTTHDLLCGHGDSDTVGMPGGWGGEVTGSPLSLKAFSPPAGIPQGLAVSSPSDSRDSLLQSTAH